MQSLSNLLPSEYLKAAEEVNTSLACLVPVIQSLEQGTTVPFLDRYRRRTTGGLDEERLRQLIERLESFRRLEERRQETLRTVAGVAPAEIIARLESTLDPDELEDLSFPYKPKRKGRGAAARDKGLQPLADWLWAQRPDEPAPETQAQGFVDPAKGVESIEQALQGARDILAERLSEEGEFRRLVRRLMWEEGIVVARKSTATKEAPAPEKESRSKYESYFDFQEPVAKIPSHRLLAIRRGVREGELESEIRIEEAKAVEPMLARVAPDRGSPYAAQLEAAVRDGYRRLLNPSMQAEVRAALKERSDEQAIRVFQENLRGVLLAPPAGRIVVVGLDGANRNDCKLAVVGADGKHLDGAGIDLSEPGGAVLAGLIGTHQAQAVAVAGGAGSREADLFVRALIRDRKLEVFSTVVSESAASAWASSPAAREEFPMLDAATRRAISVARRLQDPLAELVKVEPKAVGVGQYQHDVEQEKLERRLRATMESVINRLDVDLNTASVALLQYVSGLNERVAKRIVEHREKTGRFGCRAQLKEAPGLTDRAFQQAAGFLVVRDGASALDRTRVHPESYALVEKMAAALAVTVEELVARPELADKLKAEEFPAAPATLDEIREQLRIVAEDPRGHFVAPQRRDDVLLISDLKPGMELEGMVTNVTNFGAFVDVGVDQDGLVHISELSGTFIKDPREAVKVGDVVKVRVLAADIGGRRISLSMKPPPAPKPVRAAPRPRTERPARPAGSQSGNGRERRAPRPAEGKPAEARAEQGKPVERTKSARPPQPQAKPLSMEEKLALLQNKFRTRV